jgi:hydroxymethylpyrimidine pyrophosphatase-like HAD family hydrolase
VTLDPIAAWSARTDVPPGTIRVALVDIDGVVTPGEGRQADLAVLSRLRELNAAAASDPFVPAIALCTGRQAPYVEVFAQLTGTFLPSIFEHGAGLFVPSPFRYIFHPSLPSAIYARLVAIRTALRPELLEPGRAFIQPGKEATVTIYPLGATTVDNVLAHARLALGGFSDFAIVQNTTCVEVLPVGIDKAAGLRWLASELSLAPATFAGVGDAETDLGFLRLVGWSAAPANSVAAVTSAVHYVSPRANGSGLVDILERIVAANRATRGGT